MGDSFCGAECDAADGLFQQNGNAIKNNQGYELRGSHMYNSCICTRRNGLQDNCPRTTCQSKSSSTNMPTSNYTPSSYPLKFDNTMMGDNSQSMYYEPVGNEQNKPLQEMSYSQYSPQINAYQNYPGTMPSVPINSGYRGYPSEADGMSYPPNWNQGSLQGNYPRYM